MKRTAARGEVVTLARLWTLAQAWYHDRLDPAFRGRTTAEAEAIFAAAGLCTPFWRADPAPSAAAGAI